MEDHHSDNELSLSFQSSSFESIPEIIRGSTRSNQPYQVEPEIADESDEDSDIPDDPAIDWDERLRNTNWCQCGHCAVMPKAEECICCQEISRMQDRIEELSTPTLCITEHPGLTPVCLNPYVLETVYFQYRYQYGEIQATNEEKNRYTAYRQLVRWCWGYLGKSVRVRLPACATLAIRNQF